MGNRHNWKRNLVVLWASQFLGLCGFACAMPFIPLLLRDNLGITDDAVRGFYVSAYYFCGMISFTIATLVWGMLADRFGYKIMLLRACYAAAFFFPMLAFAPTVGVLLIIRFLTSFFSGTYNAAQTLLATTTPPEKHGFALGTLSSALWSGHMTGYFAGGMIVHYFGYTAAFITCGALYLSGALLVQFFAYDDFSGTRNVPKKQKEKISLKQLLTPAILNLLVLFLLMGVARRIDEPFLAMLVEVVCGRGNEAFYTGVVSSVAAVGGLISGVFIGRLCDRLSPVRLLIPLLAMSAITTLLQGVSGNIWMLLVMRFLAHFAAGGLYPVMLVIMSRITAPDFRGTFFGMSSSINTAGGVLCSLVSGSIAYFVNIRGIWIAAAVLFILMIPLSQHTFAVIKRSNLKN